MLWNLRGLPMNEQKKWITLWKSVTLTTLFFKTTCRTRTYEIGKKKVHETVTIWQYCRCPYICNCSVVSLAFIRAEACVLLFALMVTSSSMSDMLPQGSSFTKARRSQKEVQTGSISGEENEPNLKKPQLHNNTLILVRFNVTEWNNNEHYFSLQDIWFSK